MTSRHGNLAHKHIDSLEVALERAQKGHADKGRELSELQRQNNYYEQRIEASAAHASALEKVVRKLDAELARRPAPKGLGDITDEAIGEALKPIYAGTDGVHMWSQIDPVGQRMLLSAYRKGWADAPAGTIRLTPLNLDGAPSGDTLSLSVRDVELTFEEILDQIDLVPDNEKTHNLPDEFGTEIFRTVVGSRINGTEIEDGDRDEMGIAVEPMEFVAGLKNAMNANGTFQQGFEQWTYRTQPDGARSGPGDLDLTVYSLRKWCKLAAAGNPSVLVPLFVPPEAVLFTTPEFEELRRNTAWFLSKHTLHRFEGFARSQREKLLGERPQSVNRTDLIAKHGFDTKFAYHMVRLAVQGQELASAGTINMPMEPAIRSWLINLREGRHTQQEAIDMANRYIADMLTYEGNFPDDANHAAIDEYLGRTYMAYWESWMNA